MGIFLAIYLSYSKKRALEDKDRELQLYRDKERLEESLQLTQFSVDHMTDAAIWVGPDGSLLLVNKAACHQLGYTQQQLLSLTIGDITPEFSDGQWDKHWEKIKLTQSMMFESIFKRYDGGTLPVEILSNYVYFKGKEYSCLFARDIRERKQAEEVLVASKQQLRSLTTHLQSVREEQRSQIAREIHDGLGQELTAIRMDLSWMESKLPPDQEVLQERIHAIEDLTDSMLQTVKRITSELRPAVLDDLGILAAIDWETSEFSRRSGIPCNISHFPENIELDSEISTAVYRICQEALTNVARHAQATEVSIDLNMKGNMLTLVVQDNGIGIKEEESSHPGSFGLIGIRERAMQFGGEVRINGISGIGTILSVNIPLSQGSTE